MSTESRLLPVVAITGSSIMVACGGYSGGSCGSFGSYGSYGSFGSFGMRRVSAKRAPAARTAASYMCPTSIGADGVYEGVLTNDANQQQTSVVAIIADNGEGRMSAQDGTYYRLNVSSSGASVSGSFSGFSQGATFPDGRQSTSGSLAATITQSGLGGALTDQSGDKVGLSLRFDSVYGVTSALSTLVGTWSYSVTGFSMTATIHTDGTFSANDSNNCTYSGTFGLIDPRFNAYSESFMRSCGGTSMMFAGLATYIPGTSSTPTEIRMLADDNSGDYLAAVLK